jgi:hypothetical protein
MADFSVIAQSGQVRALVQEGLLERAFHDSLFPRMLFRGDAEQKAWTANLGDSMYFTGAGLLDINLKPQQANVDPVPQTYSNEQWIAQLQSYSSSIDTNIPTSVNAIADLFVRNAQQLGLAAAKTVNRLARNKMYNAALDGQTVCDGGASSGASILPVLRLNGFTTARRPDLPAGSPVRFAPVTSGNPLPIVINIGGSLVANTVVGYSPTTAGDEIGPGSLVLGTPLSGNVADRNAVLSYDRSIVIRAASNGGQGINSTVDSVDAIFSMTQIRNAVARFRQQNVPEYADGSFHSHLDPISEAEIYESTEFQRLNTSLPDYYMYRQFAIGQMLGVTFFRNTECPVKETVIGAGDSNATEIFTEADPFAGEIWNASNTEIHRVLFSGQGGLNEYYQDVGQYITDAGLTGKLATPAITNNGIEVNSDKITLIMRAPLNRLQDLVSTSFRYVGDFVIRTDSAVGDKSRYKRMLTVEHK